MNTWGSWESESDVTENSLKIPCQRRSMSVCVHMSVQVPYMYFFLKEVSTNF